MVVCRYPQVVLYEDELADNGVTLLTGKVRVMPRCWFVLLRFWVSTFCRTCSFQPRFPLSFPSLLDERFSENFKSFPNERSAHYRKVSFRRIHAHLNEFLKLLGVMRSALPCFLTRWTGSGSLCVWNTSSLVIHKGIHKSTFSFGPRKRSNCGFLQPAAHIRTFCALLWPQMRVDGARFRLRDARIFCPFQPKEGEKSRCPISVIREYTQREETVEALAQKGLRSETHNFADPNALADKLKVVSTTTERLSF